MATEVRPIREDELDRAYFILAYSFIGDRTPEEREGMRHLESMGPSLGLYEDGEMVACLRVYPLRMFIQGASMSLGGVSGVASLPEHRRKGYVGKLLRHALAEMRERGQILSSLWTPHPPLYRRYGWMIASGGFQYRFRPKEIVPLGDASPAGRARRIAEEEWPVVAEVYRRFAERRNGYLDRDERWWREAVFRGIYDHKRRLRDVVVWDNAGGRAGGYAVYHSFRDGADDPGASKLLVDEMVVVDGAAYAGLLRYILSHDLADEVTLRGPVDEPLDLAVVESHNVQRGNWHGFMLRVVDVEKAVAARPAAAEGAFTIHIEDASAAWNQGSWRIESGGGRLSVARSDGTADVSTDAAVFAAVYNGHLRLSDAVRCGLAQAGDSRVAILADRILATDYPPHSQDFF